MAFTGLSNVDAAINNYDEGASWCCPELQGEKYLCLGGGNGAGEFTADTLIEAKDDMHKIVKANYTGVVFDVEIISGSSDDLIPMFAEAFREAKLEGLKVVVTMSHSAPYNTDTPADAVSFVKAWVRDGNIDMVSPQLYTTGHEDKPLFDETWYCKEAGCSWLLFRNSVPRFVPSIVNATHYPQVKSFFNDVLDVHGFIQWEQTL